MKKRLFSLIMAAAMATGVLGGAVSAADEGAEVTTIRFGVNGTQAEGEAYWKSLIEDFEKEHPEIKVELEMSDDFDTKLSTEYAAGNAPDVMYDFLKAQGTRVELGQYADLGDYVEEWEDWDDFLDNPKALGSLGGAQYGIPVYADARILLYNKDLFEAAGLDPNTPPTNWEELKADHEALIKRDEAGEITQVGLSIPTTGAQLVNFLSTFAEANGLTNLVDEETDEILFNTDAGIEALQFLYDLYTEGGFVWDSGDVTLDPFLTEKAALSVTTTGAYHTAVESGINVGVAAPVIKEKQATFCGMHFFYISSDSNKQDAAWEFIKYAEQADKMWDRYEQMGFIPLRKSLEEQYTVAEPEAGEALFASVAAGAGTPRVSYANIFQSLVNEAYEKVFLGTASVEDALNDAASQLQVEIEFK